MGKTFLGSQGTQDLLRPEQISYLQNAFGPNSPYSQFLNQSPEEMQAAFQSSVVEPSMQQYEQQVLPAIQQRFVDANAGDSSALNQALTQSAQSLQTQLAGQYIPFMQGQQQMGLNALGQMGGLAGQQSFAPYQQQGILGPILQMLGQMGGGYFMGKGIGAGR